ncbi:Alpha/Beta hydrolase protein [Tricladium varicosporioides]|nr:Alpha/Beta hydrolase protein [Hymenoscyphus varicosporioides]
MLFDKPLVLSGFMTLVMSTTLPIIPREAEREQTANNFKNITASRTLKWQLCYSYYCAVLDVPFDYNKPDGSRAYLPILKVPATTKPYKGMIMTNFGGPGDSGVSTLKSQATFMTQIVGNNYDIVAIEPRGIGFSLPKADCSIASGNVTNLKRHIKKLHGPYLGDDWFNMTYITAKELDQNCSQNNGGSNQIISHMSTADVVRDMINILNQYAAGPESYGVEYPRDLNFWGYSYGTIIGQTFASMYPDRVGRLVLDGVVDADDYNAGLNLKSLQDTDKAFSIFFEYCHAAGPANCAYYTGSSAHDIYIRFENSINRLDAKVAVGKGWSNATIISQTLNAFKPIAFGILYNPIARFEYLGTLLIKLENQSQNATLDGLEAITKGIEAVTPQLGAFAAVKCGDSGNIRYNLTLEILRQDIFARQNQSYMGGEWITSSDILCSTWSSKAPTRYIGAFGGKAKNPILFVGNERDPITPLQNARKGAKIFAKAEVLIIDGTGHTSITTNNKCAFGKINKYFQDGTLPGVHNFCALEAGPWNITLSKHGKGAAIASIMEDLEQMSKNYGM